jgi:hypothetical protein
MIILYNLLILWIVFKGDGFSIFLWRVFPTKTLKYLEVISYSFGGFDGALHGEFKGLYRYRSGEGIASSTQ